MIDDTIAQGHKFKIWHAMIALPYVLLAVLQFINPFLREGQEAVYCPLPQAPTVLEENIWIFPSPIDNWLGYAILLLVLYVFVLVVKRVVVSLKHSKESLGVESYDQAKVGPSALRIVAPFLLVILGFVGFVALLVILGVFGEGLGFGYAMYSLLGNVLTFANSVLVPLIIGLGIIQFIWGAVLYLIPGLDGDRVARRKGRIYMVFSVLYFVIIVFFWGVINLLSSSTGLQGEVAGNIPVVGVSINSGYSGGLADSAPGMEVGMFNKNSARETIGFSVGGAKDADNFRENIEQCYLPVPSDITYEGLFYDYIFDTKNQTGCTALFCPQYEGAVVADPFSGEDEYFLSVGLGSNIAADTFSRMPLDLVVVLDISGSMSSSFDRYYYDSGKRPDNADWSKSKMEIAKEALGAMVDRLHPDDRFGFVVFDSSAETRLEPFTMGQNGYAKAKNSVFALQPRGGTNMEAGLEKGTELVKTMSQEEGVDRERRIIFLTDAMPNTGAVEQNDLYVIGKRNAEEGIHTTFIGVGVDFNTELVEALTKEIKGANYYAIHSSTDFEKRLDIEFEYMVAPLVFDLMLQIEGGDYEIRTVYGSPEAHLATGEILNVSTLFPAPSSGGESRGGVILAHMNKVSNTGAPTRVVAAYTDRSGKRFVEPATVEWSDLKGDSASPNVRKAVLLSRYVNLIQNWLIDENDRQGKREKTVYRQVSPYSFYDSGLVVPRERYSEGNGYYVPYELNYWERMSRELVVSEDYKQLFKDFRQYMEREMEVVSEKSNLEKELQILKNLEDSPNSEYEPAGDNDLSDISRQ